MPAVSHFTLTKPVPIFDTTWVESDLKQILSDADNVQVGDEQELTLVDLPSLPWSLPVYQSTDLWGIDWTLIPKDDWDPAVLVRFEEIGRYRVAYLRFTITVYSGVVGDSMLFLFNQPNTSTQSGLHAAVHVEIGPVQEGEGILRSRSTAVEQHLIGGWNVADYPDGPSALRRMQTITKVRFLGLTKQGGLRVRAQCVFLGGMY